MAASERPPPGPDSDENEPDLHQKEGARRIVERLLREGVRKAVERGVEQISETPDNVRQFVQDLKLPREVASVVYQQIDETKNGLYRAVAKEIRDFLEQTNVTEEVVHALTKLSFEIKTEIRFIPNDHQQEGGKPVKPDVKASVRVNGLRDKEPNEGEE